MTHIERMLLATDTSPDARSAEDYALFLASMWGASLSVLSVLELAPGMNPNYPVNHVYLGELRKDAIRGLNAIEGRAAALGVPVTTRLAVGIPSEQIARAADAEQASLLVVGTRGKTGLSHVLLGSTAERVVRTSPCPVLAVRSRGREAGAPFLTHLLVPLDFSECSLDAAEYGALVAGKAKAGVTLLHVLEPVCYGLDFTLSHGAERERLQAAVIQRLDGLAAAFNAAGIVADRIVRGGLPGDAILETAGQRSCDLIVMGTHGRRGISHALAGSVAESVLRRAPCPVLTVRSPKFSPAHRRVVEAGGHPVTHA